jgi:hypothetical protein
LPPTRARWTRCFRPACLGSTPRTQGCSRLRRWPPPSPPAEGMFRIRVSIIAMQAPRLSD